MLPLTCVALISVGLFSGLDAILGYSTNKTRDVFLPKDDSDATQLPERPADMTGNGHDDNHRVCVGGRIDMWLGLGHRFQDALINRNPANIVWTSVRGDLDVTRIGVPLTNHRKKGPPLENVSSNWI